MLIERKLPETPQYLYELANTLFSLAMLKEKLGDTNSAKKHIEESLEITKKLPGTPQNLFNLTITLRAFANLEKKRDDINSAKKHFEEGLEIARKINNEVLINDFKVDLVCLRLMSNQLH